jgi:hypothetical protein
VKRLTAAIIAALLLPAAAQAKGITGMELCGAERCGKIAIPAGVGRDDEPFDTTRGGLAPTPAPYYELRFTFEHGAGHSRGIYYEPRSGLVSYSESYGVTQWAPLQPPFLAAVKEATKRIEPFPTPRITAVYVGDRRVHGDASTYLRLFGVKGPFVVPDIAADLEWIRFDSPDTNAWTTTALAFYPQDGVLLTGATYVKLPAALAAEIAAARPLGSPPDAGTRLPWVAIGTALAGLLVLLALALRRTSAREVAPVH